MLVSDYGHACSITVIVITRLLYGRYLYVKWHWFILPFITFHAIHGILLLTWLFYSSYNWLYMRLFSSLQLTHNVFSRQVWHYQPKSHVIIFLLHKQIAKYCCCCFILAQEMVRLRIINDRKIESGCRDYTEPQTSEEKKTIFLKLRKKWLLWMFNPFAVFVWCTAYFQSKHTAIRMHYNKNKI